MMNKTHQVNSQNANLAKFESPYIHSRDELASLDVTQLRNKISETETKINDMITRGFDPKRFEIECCYLRRELETRPQRKESSHEEE